MAKGRGKRQLLLVLTAALFALLVIAGIVPNPLPAVWAWLSEDRPLAPELAWQDRLASRPGSAAAAADTVTVAAGSAARMYERDSGEPVPAAADDEWSAEWVVVAGTGADTFVITSARGESGYQIREPRSAEVLHTDDEAVAVWGFRDAWLDLRCADGRICQLRGYQPGSTEPVWRTDLPGERSGMLGGNPPLAAPRTVDAERIDPGISGPEPAPSLLGLTVTRRGGDVVVVLDPGSGRILQELEQADGERVLVVGDRVLRSELTRHHGVCVGAVSGHDPATGDPVWGPEPYHLWRTGDVGCEQRTPPLAGGAAVSAVAPDGRPVVLDAYDGRVLWSGELGEAVEGLSPQQAVIRADDGTTVYGVALGSDRDQLWQRRADRDATLTVARCGVVVSDRHPNRVYVWDPDTGDDLLSLPTSARVLACAPDGLLLAEGRSVGFAQFGDAAGSPDDRSDGGDDGSEPPLDAK